MKYSKLLFSGILLCAAYASLIIMNGCGSKKDSLTPVVLVPSPTATPGGGGGGGSSTHHLSITSDSGGHVDFLQFSCNSSGSVCSGDYDSTNSMVLTAVADSGYTFQSWSGCTSTSSNQCTVSMSADRNVTATFASSGGGGGGGSSTHHLSITSGSGGHVNFLQFTCNHSGSVCSGDYASTNSVVLTPVADWGSTFQSWSGCDSINYYTNECTVSMSADKNPSATFLTLPPPTNFHVDATLSHYVGLRWNFSSGGANVGGLAIYRALGTVSANDPSLAPIKYLTVADTQWTDSTVTPGNNYTYGIVSYTNGVGNSQMAMTWDYVAP